VRAKASLRGMQLCRSEFDAVKLKTSTNYLVAGRRVGDARSCQGIARTDRGVSGKRCPPWIYPRNAEHYSFVISRYSYRRASTGSMREAFSAGHMPAVTPTKARITKAVSITLLDVFRTISPS